MHQRRIVTKQLDINVLLAFSFGVIFLSVLLIFAVTIENPSATAQQIFITVLAVAASGVGAVIPGLLNINLPFAKAGGALAVFLLVYLNEPAIVTGTAKFVVPDLTPDPVVASFLEEIDSGRLHEAWEKLDPDAKSGIAKNYEEFHEIYSTAAQQFGQMTSRRKLGTNLLMSPSGYPAGAYKVIGYNSKSTNGKCYMEYISVKASPELTWHVYAHNIDPRPIDCDT